MITIPKELIKEKELILIPRKKYEELLRIAKKKGHTQLDRDLDNAITEYGAGKCFGPFSSVKALKNALEK